MLAFFQFVCLAVAVRASPLPSHVHQHARSIAPNGFSHIGPATPEQQITFRVALKANNVSGLQERLASISDPRSSTYGQWLSADEITAHMQPSPQSVAAFHGFASDNGLNATAGGGHGEWMSFTTNISHANTIFAASFQQFQHHTAASPITRTLSYSLPFALADHVDTVHPMTTFGTPLARRNTSPASGAFRKRQQAATILPPAPILPSSLQLLYNIPVGTKDPAGVSILIEGLQNNIPQANDTAAFLEHFRPDIPSNTTVNIISINGGLDTQSLELAKNGNDTEANLDVQTVLGLAAGIPTSFLSVGGVIEDSDFPAGLLATTDFLSTTESPPSVFTTSASNDEAQFSPQDLQKICNGFMAAGARGISVIFSSGDNGVHARDSLDDCSNNDFVVEFPPSCPYVTAVGSTFGIPERVAPFSAGGFSNTFDRPTYQDPAVTGFLSTIPSDFPGMFNKGGRGYPDVALQGVNFLDFIGGALNTTSGTSASAPAFAALVALLNAQLISEGQSSLGFLNPFIYNVAGPAGAFNDITVGNNTGLCSPANTTAFSAVTGWDATTGWGTPDFVRLFKAARQSSNNGSDASAGSNSTGYAQPMTV